MSFANPLPWWALALVVGAAALVAWLAYSRQPLSPSRRRVLVTLRFVTLLALVVFLMRPVARATDANVRDAVVAILVDTSRSMSIEDAEGAVRRIDRARADPRGASAARARIAISRRGPRLRGWACARGARDLAAAARRSDVEGALAAVRARYRDRRVAGIVLLSDGGDTSGAGERAADGGPPIFALGVGSPTVGRDREILERDCG